MRVFKRICIFFQILFFSCFAAEEEVSIWSRPLLADICRQYGFGTIPRTPAIETRQRTFDPESGFVTTDRTVNTYRLMNGLISINVLSDKGSGIDKKDDYVSECQIYISEARSSKVMRDALVSGGVTRFLAKHGIVVLKDLAVDISALPHNLG